MAYRLFLQGLPRLPVAWIGHRDKTVPVAILDDACRQEEPFWLIEYGKMMGFFGGL
jgi:hypothetical protein